jgi:hypothetical protein
LDTFVKFLALHEDKLSYTFILFNR